MSNKIKYISPFNYKRFDGGLQKISLSYQIFGKPIGVSPRLIGVCHYVSSMSDTQAVITYKKISGNHF